MSDPREIQVATAELGELSAALDVVDERAVLNHRYRKLIHTSREELAAEHVRLSQARGIAKRLMVLARAGGEGFAESLPAEERRALDDGLAKADELVFHTEPG
ncbi:hypothetical protein GCM10027174_20090 [Salinifilum aidingensis]